MDASEKTSKFSHKHKVSYNLNLFDNKIKNNKKNAFYNFEDILEIFRILCIFERTSSPHPQQRVTPIKSC